MAFNLQTWREQCKAYLKDLKQRIADRKVDSIYGTIAAAAVWPVIAAFQQGDLSALVALGQVLAGVGTNLLAGGLQSWRDQAEAARNLKERLAKKPALREEIDTIVEKKKRGSALDEPPVARKIKMQQVLGQGQRLVITGGPGCGKTTVLMHIAWTLVAAMAGDDPAYAKKRLGIAGDLPLPKWPPLPVSKYRPLPRACGSNWLRASLLFLVKLS